MIPYSSLIVAGVLLALVGLVAGFALGRQSLLQLWTYGHPVLQPHEVTAAGWYALRKVDQNWEYLLFFCSQHDKGLEAWQPDVRDYVHVRDLPIDVELCGPLFLPWHVDGKVSH